MKKLPFMAILLLVTLPACASLFHYKKKSHNREKLVWQENFHQKDNPRPDPAIWAYEEGGDGWGNRELEVYCAWASTKAPCDSDLPNAFIGNEGYLHLVARRTHDGRYTSARLVTKHLKTVHYGRVEARIRIPAGPGLWPAFWLLRDDIDTIPWPTSGEIDVMENIGREPGIIHGTIHGEGLPPEGLGKAASLPGNTPFSAAFHNFGMIWKPGSVAFYMDDPGHPYATYTPAGLPVGAIWPFDGGPYFLMLNLAVGGSWPESPDRTTPFPAEMLVEHVKIWTIE